MRASSASSRRKYIEDVTKSKRPATAEPSLPPRVLRSVEQVEANLQRLYFRPVELKQQRIRRDEGELADMRSRHRPRPRNKLSKREEHATQLLYYSGIERRKIHRETLAKAHEEKLSWRAGAIKHTTISEGCMQEMSHRLSSKALEQQETTRRNIEQKLYPTAEPHVISRQQELECARRMSASILKHQETLEKAEARYAFVPNPGKKV